VLSDWLIRVHANNETISDVSDVAMARTLEG
jgi:hypothetical protein